MNRRDDLRACPLPTDTPGAKRDSERAFFLP